MNQIGNLSIFAREALRVLNDNPASVLRRVTTWRPIVGNELVAQVATPIEGAGFDGLWIGGPRVIDELMSVGLVFPFRPDQYQLTPFAKQVVGEVMK